MLKIAMATMLKSGMFKSISRFLVILYILSSILAAAFDDLAHALPAGCLHNAAYRDLSSLVHKSRVYGRIDRRKEMTADVERELKFTSRELQQINKSIGAFFCPAEPGFKQIVGTAFLMSNNDEIRTAGHLTIGEDGRHRDLSKCKFTNFDKPRETFEIDANAKRNALPKWDAGVGEGRYDSARLKLKRPVKGATPLAPDPKASALEKGDQIFMFSSQHRDFNSTGNRPVISICKAGGFKDLGEGVTQLKTDCDSSRGGSGAPILVRRNGSLFLESMNIGEANSLPDANSEFDENSNYQSTLSVIGEGLK